MDDDIQEVFDCFERKLDAELMEITAIILLMPPLFDVDDSGPFG